MYILASKARRKNAKRHIDMKSENIEELRQWAKVRPRYLYEIYDGRWNLVEKLPDGQKKEDGQC